MEAKKKRLTLELDPIFEPPAWRPSPHSKGVSVRRYCQVAIDREVAKDEADSTSDQSSNKPEPRVVRRAPTGDIRRQARSRELCGSATGGP